MAEKLSKYPYSKLAMVFLCFSLLKVTQAQDEENSQANEKLAKTLRDALPGSVPRPAKVTTYNCGTSFFLPEVRFLTIKPHATDGICNINFFGSRVQKCTARIICKDIATKSTKDSKKCAKEYFKISDGLGGMKAGCGKNLSLANTLSPTHFGHDLYVSFKGMADKGYCDIFCAEDQGAYDELSELGGRRLPSHASNKRKIEESCVCGMRRKGPQDGRIVGGVNAKPFEFPWMAGLILNQAFYNTNGESSIGPRSPVCGGSLITDRHILTAAHCFYGDTKPESIQVLLHAHVMDALILTDLNEEELAELRESLPGGNLPAATDEQEKSLRFSVEKIVNHPLYKRGGEEDRTYDFDAAIIFLKERVNFKTNNSIRPICLYQESVKKEKVPKDDLLEVAGWGVIKEGGQGNSRILQKMKVPIIEWKTCTRFMPYDLAPRHICAAYKQGKIDSCQGDSGSPAIMPLKGNQYHQVGLVSSGVGCARAGSPGLYTSTYEVIEWIYHQTRKAVWCKQS